MENFLAMKIIDLAVCEFWLDGELSSPSCVLFIKDQHQNCWKAFFDDEENLWRLHSTDEAFPSVGWETGDREMLWRDIRPDGASKVIGYAVASITVFDDQLNGGLILKFQNGASIALSHNYRADTTSFAIE